MRLFKRHENQRLPSEAELKNVRDRVQSIRQRSLAGAGSLSELFSAIAEDDQWAVDNAPLPRPRGSAAQSRSHVPYAG